MWYAATIAFSVMFPDSEIVSVMRLERTKVGYLVSFGLTLYFSYLHTKNIQETDCVVTCFDKSSQDQQVDVCIRYWSILVVQFAVDIFPLLSWADLLLLIL